MTTHFSILAWEIPQTGEPVRLQSMGLQRAGHDLVTKTNNNKQHAKLCTPFSILQLCVPAPLNSLMVIHQW